MIDLAFGFLLAVTGVVLAIFRANIDTFASRVRRLLALLAAAFGFAFLLGILSLAEKHAPGIVWREDLEVALREAKAQGKPAIIDATAEWCAACKQLDRRTFSDPTVQSALKDFVTIRIDMTRFDEAAQRLQELGIDVKSLPLVAFFLPDGRINPGVTLRDFEPPSLFLRRLEAASTYRETALTPVEVWLGQGGIPWAFLLAFLAGIGVSLTPCVYPIIPITMAIVGARNSSGPPPGFRRRLTRSLVFVAGLALMYTLLGVASAVLGFGFGSWLQHPIVTGGVALLFFILGCSYVGFFTLDIPASLKQKITTQRAGLIGIALLGASSGIVLAPCAGPVVVGILAIISTTRDVALGAAFMLVFASGMGLLFLAVGASTFVLERLPKSGRWMQVTEVLFAICLFVVAIYYGKLAMVSL